MYVLNILPKRLLKVMVSGEHFVLKDLPFYEEAREADTKARQERLEQREEKMQERKLRKALGERGHGSSSMGSPPVEKKKKKTIAKVIKVVSPTPEPSSTSTALASNRSTSSTQVSEGDSSSSRLDTINSGIDPSQPGPKSIALGVVNEPKKEEDMNDLRVVFKEKHHKCLYEVINMVLPPPK